MVQNLLSYYTDHLEALLATNAIHYHIAMDADEVLAVQYRVLVLPGSIDDLGRKVLVLISYYFRECVLDGRVICIDEVAVNVLDGEGGLACIDSVVNKVYSRERVNMIAYRQTCYRQ